MDKKDRQFATAVQQESPTGLRAMAANLRRIAAAISDPERGIRLIAMASRYEERARELAGDEPSKSSILRARAKAIYAELRNNPEPQWQRARVLAEIYLREADKLDGKS